MRKILINGLARCDIEDIDGYLRFDVDTDVIHIIRIFHELQDYAHILLNSES